ncbi:HAD hydrolase-like protein [Puniceicoccaceae bacterium K14]|nr:HAD hydrolase-like protein [Puniceicoccaceae bacterium K14]
MLAIFDIDGTLCDSQQTEDICFSQTIKEILDIELTSAEWSNFPDPTSSGILKDLLKGQESNEEVEQAFKQRYLDFLKQAQPEYPQDFSPIEGAVEFLEVLKKQNICDIAIATGGFDTEAEFKLKCCGIDLHEYPHATSSDTPKRKDIIPLAAKRAKYPLCECIYFGDASWDIKVSRKSHSYEIHNTYEQTQRII